MNRRIRVSPLALILLSLASRAADPQLPVSTNAVPPAAEAEAPATSPSPEILAALEEARVAAESMLKREAYLSASNATVRALVEKRAKLTQEREETISQMPEVKELEEKISKSKADWVSLVQSKAAAGSGQEEARKALRVEMAKQRREYRRLTLDVATADPKVAALNQKLQEIGKEIQAALANDPTYAGLLRSRNKAMLRHQRLTQADGSGATPSPAPATPEEPAPKP